MLNNRLIKFKVHSLTLIFLLSFCASCGQDTGVAPDIFTKVYVYQSDTTYTALTMPSRSVTTNACSVDYQANRSSWEIDCANFVAFVGYSADSGVLNLPSTYGLPIDVPYVGVDETLLAHDWSDFTTTIDVGLTGAGFNNNFSWTGITNGGALGGNCNDWTSNLNSDAGNRTQVNSAGAVWNNSSVSCNFATDDLPLICLCW